MNFVLEILPLYSHGLLFTPGNWCHLSVICLTEIPEYICQLPWPQTVGVYMITNTSFLLNKKCIETTGKKFSQSIFFHYEIPVEPFYGIYLSLDYAN